MQQPVEAFIPRFAEVLQQKQSAYFNHLLRGLSPQELSDLEAQLHVSLPDDFKQLYAWRNGMASDYDYRDRPIADYAWLNSNDIIMHWQTMNSIENDGGFDELEDWWDRSWIPFLNDITGYSHCIDMKGYFGGKVGQVLDLPHNGDRKIAFSSLSEWLQTIIEALEQGILPLGEDNFAAYMTFPERKEKDFYSKI